MVRVDIACLAAATWTVSRGGFKPQPLTLLAFTLLPGSTTRDGDRASSESGVVPQPRSVPSQAYLDCEVLRNRGEPHGLRPCCPVIAGLQAGGRQ